MENQFSKQDKTIDAGVTALRDMWIDVSEMSQVLSPRPRRSPMLPIGMATALACAIGAAALLIPSKSEANPFQKVKEAVLKQNTVHEKSFRRVKDGVWELEVETYQDVKQKGVKWGKAKGGHQVVITDGKKFEKFPEKVDIVITNVSAEFELKLDDSTESINEILARDGMEFIGIKRSQKKDGRTCDVYHVTVKGETTDYFYYVDPKTDLPFLQEVVDKDGKVVDKVEISFSATIKMVDDESVTFSIVPDLKVKPVNGSSDLFTVEAASKIQKKGK